MNEVTMKQVENSSNVRAYGYDQATSTLVIIYKPSTRYHYFKVPPERIAEMDQTVAADQSIGKYIHQRIKGYYEGEKQ